MSPTPPSLPLHDCAACDDGARVGVRAVLSLAKLAAALDGRMREDLTFLDPRSGEVRSFPRDLLATVEDGDEEELDVWEREQVPYAVEVLQGPWLRLPDSDDVDDWRIMRDFSDTVADDARDELLSALHRKGAYRRFREAVDELELREPWWAFRAQALRTLAQRWCEGHGLPFGD